MFFYLFIYFFVEAVLLGLLKKYNRKYGVYLKTKLSNNNILINSKQKRQ